MKKITLCLVAITCYLYGFSQVTFQKTYGGTGTEFGWFVQQTFDGGYIITGYTNSTGAGGNDVLLVKTNSTGDTLWTRTYGGSGDDYGYSVRQNTDSGYTIAANTTSFGPGNSDIYLIRTNSVGDTIWTRCIGGTGNDAAESMELTGDGGCIISGLTSSFGASGTNLYLLKTDSNGNLMWSKTFGSFNNNYGYDVKPTNDGGYILAGDFLQNIYLVKTDANGDTIWTRTYLGSGNDYASNINQTSDGGYIITGASVSYGAGGFDCFLLKTNSSGNLQWFKTYGGMNSDYGYTVEQTIDGGYVMFGDEQSFGGGSADFYLVRTDAAGDTLWTKTYGSTGSDVLYAGACTSDGGYIMTGTTINSFGPGYELYLIKTDSSGNTICNINASATITNQYFPGQYDSPVLVSNGGWVSGTNTIINRGLNETTICISSSAVEIIGDKDALIIFPNPASSQISIIHNQPLIKNTEIYNIAGEKIYTSEEDLRSNTTIDVSSLNSGIYIVQMNTDKKIIRAKFVKK